VAVATDNPQGSALGTNGTPASSLTYSYTVSAALSNSILVVQPYSETGTSAVVSSVTYGGVPLTKAGGIAFQTSGSAFEGSDLWYLLSPAAGTANIVVTWAATMDKASVNAVTLTGAAQQAPSVEATVVTGSATASPQTISITTVTDGALVLGGFTANQEAAITMSTGTLLKSTLCSDGGGGGGAGAIGYAIKSPAGSQSLVFIQAGLIRAAAVIAAFAPAPSGTTFNQSVLASNQPTNSIVRQAGKPLRTTNTPTKTLVRAVTKPLTTTTTPTKSLNKQTAKTLLTTSTLAASLVAARAFLKAVLAATAPGANMVRQTGKLLLSIDGAVASVARSTAKALRASTTPAKTLTALKVKLVSLLASTAPVASVSRGVGKVLRAIASAVARLTQVDTIAGAVAHYPWHPPSHYFVPFGSFPPGYLYLPIWEETLPRQTTWTASGNASTSWSTPARASTVWRT
jgi:hypothetical protein